MSGLIPLILYIINQPIYQNMSTRRTPRTTYRHHQDSDQEFQHNYDPNSEMQRNQQPRTRITRNAKVNYIEEDKKDNQQEQDMQEQPIEQTSYDFLAPKVEALLWKVDSENIEEEKYLVKFFGRSYLQTKWMNRKQLSEIGYQITSNVLKSTKIKMRKTVQLKLKDGGYFNPNYLLADRVLSSTQIFTAIHHKRANDIKGKWDQSIMLVCQKILNFVKGGYPYGVLLHQPYDQQLQKNKAITKSINIGQILNKVYLSFYQNQFLFWEEIGTAINNFILIYPQDHGDFHIVGLTIRQCLIFLYEQWHHLSKQRYLTLKQELASKGIIQMEQEKPQAKQESNIMIAESPRRVNIKEQYCSTNIFLTEKIVDSPKNHEELQKLNPGQFSYSWLQTQNQKQTKFVEYEFKLIDESDFKSLDLNVEVDKLYLVKWKDLSYKEMTWQSQKNMNAIEKIEQFKLWNKIPVREVREKMEMHNKIHKFLMEFYEIMSEKKGSVNPNVVKMETKLYLLDSGTSKTPKQYGGKDIPIYKNHRMLKDFQLQSLNWLIKNWYENRNTILADEMGLGKTIQTISFLFHLHAHQGVLGPFLILAPLTTLHQWRREIEQWTTFNCLLYYDEGSSEVREKIQMYEFYHMHTTKTGDIIPSRIPKFQILLTNYELFINDFDILKKIPYQHIVLDQAHRLKNKNTKTTTTLNKLPCCRKTLLTGTPIQNNTRELWTLLNFIEPKEFNSEELFLQQYGNLSTEEQVKNFKKMLKPYILRRVKQDVESTIPRLSETIIDVEMSANQKTYYRGILQKNKTAMLKSLTAANFNSISTQLRKCCNHPYLISAETQAQIKMGVVTAEQQMQKFIKSSGKMILLMKLLQKFKKQGKKVLIFSQFVVMIDLMKPYLQMCGYNCQLLKGSQSSTQRHQAITRFNQQATDIFLISTKAGGVGINLVAATQIIIYDSDWNPQNDIQATARAHRIGQKKEVTVYRLITANSYESQMFQMSSKKLGLDKAIFTGDTFKSMGQFDEAQKQLTKAEIETLLKKGIVGFLQSNVNQQQFFNQSIEDILSKNARKVEYAVTQNSCTFSKTKFKSEETNDINIDAPDFWEQALKGIETPVDKLVKKRKELKDYSSLQKQQELMLETYRIVLNFVKQKTLGTGFNAQDERNLLRFLEAITSERHFTRHFRDIADLLSIQIIKPSRRFKIKEEDILVVTTATEEKKEQVPEKRQSTRIKKQKNDDNYGLDAPGEQDQISNVSEEKEESPSPQEKDKNTEQQQKANEQFQRLCSKCQRPKCTIFCIGVCGRPFHRKCFQLHTKGQQQKIESIELQQFTMSYQQWKQKREYDTKCINCKEKNYLFKCAICLQSGVYQEEETNKRRKKPKTVKEEKQQDQFNIYKCSAAAKCNKFYHLQCLFSEQFKGKFSDHTGKTVKDISNTTKLFRCPSHYCNVCYGIDSKSTKLKSYSCIRCCRSYHDKCQDKQQFVRLGADHYYICLAHLQDNQTVDSIADQIRKLQPNKKDKVAIKKKNKEKIKEIQQQPQHKIDKKQQESTQDNIFLRRSKRLKKQDQMEVESSKHEQPEQMQEQHNLNSSKSSKKSKKSGNKVEQPSSKDNKQSKLKKQLEETQAKKSKSKPKHDIDESVFAAFKYQYADFNLTPIHLFNFSEYKHSWCRFCGSRYAKSFELGPWGTNKLCSHHYEQFKKGRLKLDKYKNEPKYPINKGKENELRYLNDYVKNAKITPQEAIVQLNKELGIK